MNKKQKQILTKIAIFIIFIIVAYITENIEANFENKVNNAEIATSATVNIEEIPQYKNDVYIKINDNIPYFTKEEYTTESFEKYSELDSLGRCGVAYANICKEIMPAEGKQRGDISTVRPTGWRQSKFNGEYLYNRCHLIAHCLADEDANKLNLITGTRYFNVQGMLPFEKMVYEYMKTNKNNHVLYRVTPIFKGNNLLADGVEMEAYSIEDNGEGITFNVFVYNIQPGAEINYATGELINK